MVGGLITATQHHAVAADLDTRLLVDIDLAILGQPSHLFDAYEQQIRQEYAWVPHEAFLKGRTRILRAFLHRSTLYATDYFRLRYKGSRLDRTDRCQSQATPPTSTSAPPTSRLARLSHRSATCQL